MNRQRRWLAGWLVAEQNRTDHTTAQHTIAQHTISHHITLFALVYKLRERGRQKESERERAGERARALEGERSRAGGLEN